jgi:hypothetical protein
MYLEQEAAREHQRTMLTTATEERMRLRARALQRTTRRAQRAQRKVQRAQHEAGLLRAELAAEHS